MRALAASAYRHGAKFVDIGWFDPHVKRARIEHARRGDARLRAAVVRRARAGARRPARRARGARRGRARPACSRTSIPGSSGRTGCRRSRRASRSSTSVRPTGRSARARRRRGPTSSTRSSWTATRLERLERELLHVLRLDEEDPIARLESARRHARQHRGAAVGAPLRRAALRGARHRPDGRPAAVVGLARRALPDRRRDRAHAQPPDRGGLHDPRPRADAGQRDVDQAARADRRHGRARPRRALRGRPRQRARRLRGRARRSRRSSRPTRAPRGWGRSRWSTARAASASWGRSSTTRCSTRTRRATSRSARASRSCSTTRIASARTSREIHIDFMIGSNELSVTGVTRDRRARAGAGRGPLADLSGYPCSPPGEVPERLNGHDWKSCDGGQPRPRVRIPPSPSPDRERPRHAALAPVDEAAAQRDRSNLKCGGRRDQGRARGSPPGEAESRVASGGGRVDSHATSPSAARRNRAAVHRDWMPAGRNPCR